jgi:hypothetical protein
MLLVRQGSEVHICLRHWRIDARRLDGQSNKEGATRWSKMIDANPVARDSARHVTEIGAAGLQRECDARPVGGDLVGHGLLLVPLVH